MHQRPGMFETTAEALAVLARMTLASIVALVILYGLGRSAWDIAHLIGAKPVDPPHIPQRYEATR